MKSAESRREGAQEVAAIRTAPEALRCTSDVLETDDVMHNFAIATLGQSSNGECGRAPGTHTEYNKQLWQYKMEGAPGSRHQLCTIDHQKADQMVDKKTSGPQVAISIVIYIIYFVIDFCREFCRVILSRVCVHFCFIFCRSRFLSLILSDFLSGLLSEILSEMLSDCVWDFVGDVVWNFVRDVVEDCVEHVVGNVDDDR